MTSKLLQVIGVLAVLALVGGSFAALALVKQRVQVTVAAEEDASQRGPEPLELVRADLGELRGDVVALSDGFATQLQTLHDALDGAAQEREATLAARVDEVRRELQSLRTRLELSVTQSATERDAMRESLARINRDLVELAASVRDPASIASVAATDEPALAPVQTAAAAASAPPPPAPEPVVVVPAVPAAPKKNFLSFKVPSQSFQFDQVQRFSVIASLSRVGFDAKSTLHDFSGVTQKIEGELIANLAAPSEGCRGSIRVDASSLDTGLADRDEEMRVRLDTAAHGHIVFAWKSFSVAESDTSAMKLSGTARGELTIKGAAREIAMPVRVSVDASKRLVIEGETRLKLSDFGVVPPNKLGLITVDDEVKVWIALRARSLGPVEDEKRE